jgi:threonine synthase
LFSLACPRCGTALPLDFKGWRCPSCGGGLELTSGKSFESLGEIIRRNRTGIWRYGGAMPYSDSPITLGEGGTPLVGADFGGAELLLKLEYVSPTGAFKDRGASACITRAVAVGAGAVVEDSTGNAGVAASAYAARAGIAARVYVPADAPAGKRRLMAALGARVVECRSRGEAAARAVSDLRAGELYIGHSWDPFYIVGMKTAAYEIFEAGAVPDSVILPVASGTLLLGLRKGFAELLSSGLIDEVPRLFAVQGEGCAPIYRDIHGEHDVEKGSVLADGLRIADPPRRGEIVEAIRSTGGDVFIVSDPEISQALKQLWRMGVMAEPTSATALAAFLKNRQEMGGKTIMPVTGTGMKNLDGLIGALGGSP